MSTKNAISLLSVVAGLVPIFTWLAAKRGLDGYVFLAIIASIVALGLLVYAAFREQTTEDKSKKLSRRAMAMIFCSVGVWVIFCFYRALH